MKNNDTCRQDNNYKMKIIIMHVKVCHPINIKIIR